MTHIEIREKFLEFFNKNGHKIIPSSSLVPQDDSSVLLTTAGMQQFKPYYLEKESPFGNRATSIQKCFRTSDIEEVGDERHLTFFEMLGNFSFKYPSGKVSYFKEEAIKLAYEFITKKMNLEIEYVSVFNGDKEIPRDDESVKIWKNLGVSDEKIKFFGKEDNFWGPTGDEGPCGPTTEIYVNGIEIWNIVFNEYYFNGKKYEKLKYQGIDTGMGLERLAMIVQKKTNVFETDLFQSIMDAVNSKLQFKIKNLERNTRIIADHIRAISFLIADGIEPSNTGQGYILRRLIRRARYYYNSLGAHDNALGELVYHIVPVYKETDYGLDGKISRIDKIITSEEMIFSAHLVFGKKILEKIIKNDNCISGENAFLLYSTYGYPFELILDIAKEKNIKVDEKGFLEKKKIHQEISRAGAENKFGGHGIKSENTNIASIITNKITKLHTATHLLQAALRVILGNEVHQMGSDINEERLRFDFSFNRKLTNEEILSVQNLVNEKIKEGLKVEKEEMKYEDALKSGALAFFKEKYPETVTVYSVQGFSKEICGGPHVKNTSELDKFKITKEESSSAGVRRIKAVLE